MERRQLLQATQRQRATGVLHQERPQVSALHNARLLILDEEYFLLFEPDKNIKNSGQLLKKALLLNVDIMIDRSDPRTLMVGIKLPPKGFRVSVSC